MGKASLARKLVDIADDLDLDEFVPSLGDGSPVDAAKHFLSNPKRSLFPGIYKEPRQLVDEANERFEPEGPELQQIFGVSRSDLADMADRKGDAEIDLGYGGKYGLKVKSTDGVTNQRNADRLLSALDAARDDAPGLWRGMKGWYQMDPAADMMQSWYGKEEGLRLYNRFNAMTAMASPGSEVVTELQRGSAANMMHSKGRFDEFATKGGTAEDKRTKQFPKELRGVIGHPYHRTAHAGPMQKFVDNGGDVDMGSAKVPLYAGASRKLGDGKQTTQPVADAHFSRAIGFSDVVGDNTNPGRSMKRDEYRKIPQWFREKVSGEMGIEAVPAQAILWGLMSPQTGVTSSIGAPKLELLARGVIAASKRTGRDPKEMLKAILSGEEHAYAGGGAVARKLIDGTFYSALAEALPTLQKKLTGNQALSQLRKAGVKDDELSESGLSSYLDGLGDDVTTSDNVSTAHKNPVEVRTDELSNRAGNRAREALHNDDRFKNARMELEDDEVDRYFDPEPFRSRVARDEDDGLWKIYDDNGDEVGDGFADEVAARDRFDELSDLDRDNQEQYYRDGIDITDDAVESHLGIIGEDSPEYFEPSFDYGYKTKGGTNYREMLIKLNGGKSFDANANHSNHWEDKGHEQVLASLRLQDHKAPGGKKVLLADETQSDWGQAYRDAGDMSEEGKIERLTEELIASRRAANEIHNQYTEKLKTDSSPDTTRWFEENIKPHNQNQERLQAEIRNERGKEAGRVDKAPFIDNTSKWVDLAIKKTLSEAAKADADIVAWPKGADVADRYNMRKVISELTHNPMGDGRHYILAKDPQGRTVHSGQYGAEELDGIVGKGLADKIRADEGEDLFDDVKYAELKDLHRKSVEEHNSMGEAVKKAKDEYEASAAIPSAQRDHAAHQLLMQRYNNENSTWDEAYKNANAREWMVSLYEQQKGRRRLAGDGISVGGEGHISFYDNIYPKRMAEVMRKAGLGKPAVEDVQLVTGTKTKNPEGYSKGQQQMEMLKTEGYLPLEATMLQGRDMMEQIKLYDPDAFMEVRTLLQNMKEEVVQVNEGPMAQGIRLTPEMKQKIISSGFPLFLIAASLGIGEDELVSIMTEDDGTQEFAAGGYVEEIPNDEQVVDDLSMATTPDGMLPEITEQELPSLNVVEMDDGSFGIVDVEGNLVGEGFATPEEADEAIRGSETMQVPDDEHAEEIPEYAKGGAVVNMLARRLGEMIKPSEGLYVPPKGKPGTFKLPGSDDSYDALPIQEIEEVARRYSRGRGLDNEITAYPDFDDERAARIAVEYNNARHDPRNPKVKAHYDEMIDETMDQYRALDELGLDFRFLKDGEADPYAASPALGYKDLVENGRLSVFPTDSGFGSSDMDVSSNPLLKRVGKIGDLENATANDAFRVVHDTFGHFGPGNPFFRHKGEDRAWMHHSKMFGPRARRAMTSETRGQNSWLNFGPHAEKNRTALGGDTHFADQKTTLLPEWASEMDDVPEFSIGGLVSRIARSNKMLAKARQNAHRMDNDELWYDTQFYKGLEGDDVLKHEIDDSELRIKDWPDRLGGKARLDDILDHEELFDNYPQLRDYGMETVKSGDGLLAAFDIDNRSILLPSQKELENFPDNGAVWPEAMRASDRPKSTLMHEVQHAIQGIEGFENGSSNAMVRNQIHKILGGNAEKSAKARKARESLLRNGFEDDQDFEAYRRVGGEVESRAVEDRINLPRSLRQVSMPMNNYDVDPRDVIMPRTRDFAYNLKPTLKVLR